MKVSTETYLIQLKHAQIHFYSKRPDVITRMNDKINMKRTIAELTDN
jgi:biotin carboxylase